MIGEAKPPAQAIGLTGVASEGAFGTPTVWQMCSFAPDWFADAVAEARSNGGRAACRREIVFAVCTAEAYLIEWVRDDLLNPDFAALNSYFPSQGRRLGVRDRWKEVVGQLYAD